MLANLGNYTQAEQQADDEEEEEKAKGDGTQIRNYINSVEIKVRAEDALGIEIDENAVGDIEYLTQVFRVTTSTTFIDMLHASCTFWDMNSEEFTLVLPNMHEIMTVNFDKKHSAHTLCKYFEIHRSKKAVMFLIRPTQKRTKVLDEEL
jgi:hypothetical protein